MRGGFCEDIEKESQSRRYTTGQKATNGELRCVGSLRCPMIPLEQLCIVLLLISYFLGIVSVSYFTQRAITSDAITEATLTIVDI